jgi:DNA replication and repair protein RecF
VRLDRVNITSVRNLGKVQISGLRQTNVFFGTNGSGKTSFLEALHILGVARSFRTHKIKTVVSRGESGCTVYGERAPSSREGRVAIGVRRDLDGSYQIRIDGRNVASTAELAAHLPVLCVNADSFNLFLAGPASRRKYLDWSVFHVEQLFYPAWKKYQRCIKQRNTILRRDKLDRASLAAWSAELAEAGETLSELRRTHFDGLRPLFVTLARELSDSLEGIDVGFSRGWDATRSLAEVLESGEASDIDRGFTQSGPHRADLRIKLNGINAVDILSRGQMKLAICALTLAQGSLLGELTGRSCMYLVDDLPSELDMLHRELFCRILANLGSQVFVTCVNYEDVSALWPDTAEVAVFHVEHGEVTPFEVGHLINLD